MLSLRKIVGARTANGCNCGALGAFLASCTLAFAAAADPQRLLLLSDSGWAPAELLIVGRAREALENNLDEVEIYAETLDIARFPAPEQQELVANFLRVKYADRRIHAVLAVGPSSLAFLTERRTDLFSDSPVVYGAVRATSVSARLGDATGIVSSFDLLKTLELAFALQPDARRLVVVSGAAPLDLSWNERARSLLAPYSDRIEVTYLAGLPKARVLESLRRLPRDTIVILLTMRQDGNGEFFFNGPALAAELTAAATAPAYSVYETVIGEGLVGGYVESFAAIGDSMAALTLRLLRGERASDIPPVESAKVYVVDWRALRRWGLDQARLPPDTNVLFRDPSLWVQYRAEILGVASLVALQSLLIVALLLYIRKRRVERTLSETEDRYRHVVEAQLDVICRYLPDTTLTFVNETFCRYFGRTRGELIGRRLGELIPESQRQGVLDGVRALVEKGHTNSYTHQVTLADGSVRWQQWIDHPIMNAAGRVAEIQGIGRDITELKAAETEARQRREQVTHLTRVAMLGELSGALAHELNQPITAILANAQAAQHLLCRESPDLVELRNIVKDIVADDVRAGEVIRRLRTMLKPGAAPFERVDVTALLAEVLVLVRAQLVEQRVTVVDRVARSLPPVNGDRVQLQQVLLNLVMNACDAMSDNEPTGRTMVAAAWEVGGFVRVSISDSGSGLAPQAAARLFEAFFTTKAEGLGLGLSICRSIVTLHGGSITARNNPDRGATVEFVLPAAGA